MKPEPRTPTEIWQAYLRDARWYSGKGLDGHVVAITALPWFTERGAWPAVRSEIAEVGYPDRSEYYHLLVGYEPADDTPSGARIGTVELPDLGAADVIDAPRDPAVMAVLLAALRGGAYGMEWLEAERVDPALPISLFSGEQSNTTVCVGDTVLFKVFRKLEPGRNLDVEVLAALNGSVHTPRLYGALTAESPEHPQLARVDLGLFMERVQGVVDGWEWATSACADNRDVDEDLVALGKALRMVHVSLAEAFGTGTLSGDDLAAAMQARFRQAADQVAELHDVQHALRYTWESARGTDLVTQRIHGDFHLGQVLKGEQGWTIIDFEGEPLKTMAERREFDSVWRDVAGMLRSFDYARSAHLEPDGPDARGWAADARRAFLTGYAGTDQAEERILRAYETDKAVYEVVYEARNRPNWAHIPWRAVHDEARRISLDPPDQTKEEK